nr:reverse transcriptase domain-containing protein [Tanacetum cinerariifolium]
MANTTPLVTTVIKPAINPGEVDSTPRVNIKEFCEEYYEDILPIIMEKVRHDRRKDVRTRLDFGKGPRERIKEDSHYSNTRAREPERKMNSRDPPQGRNCARTLSASRDYRLKDKECSRSIRESYGDYFPHSYHNGSHDHHMKRRRDKSPPSSGSRSDLSDGKHRRSKSKRQKPTDEDDLTRPWMCEEENPVWFDELPPESIDGYKDLRAAFLAYFMQQKKYVKDPVEIHNIKQRGGETIEDYMERFKTETGRMKGAPECMRISGFMHGVNNPELTKRLNEHVPKKMEEMMIATTAFIRGEVAAASKKKGHVSWKSQDQSKRHTLDKSSDFQASKFQPPPPMVTPVEKRSNNKFCDFHNDKAHSTDECMQLKEQIEELVRAGKLSYLIKEIKQGRDQSKTRKKEKADISLRQSTCNGTEGPLVIEAEMGGHMIHRMYIDGGSSMEILYEHCFNRHRPEIKSQMVPATTSLTGFSGETIWPLGQLRLLVIVGDATHSTKAWMNFMGVKSLSPYNGIIGRPRLKAIQAVPSTVYVMLKFPVDGGIVTICSTILIPTECASVTTSSVIPREEKTRLANFTVALHPDFPDQEVVIGGSLSDKGRTELCSVLKKNLDIFSWQPSDMTGVPWSVAEHRLNIQEGYSPVRQKKRGQTPKRARAIQAEVQNLVEAGIMREVYYHDWLSNPVMVKKHDGSWRMYVDFTDLNKACPQDCYPLPEIDWKVESLCGYPFKCFLEAYKGYHQIQLAEAGEEKTAFHTGQGVYCYTNMPFGLKNAGATYQRLMDKAFDGHVGRNIEVYVEELVVKSYTEAEMMRDIEETFRTLRKVNMKLNPKKCLFGLTKGVFLGPDADLLYKPCVTGSRTKLLVDGETGLVTSLRSKKTPTGIDIAGPFPEGPGKVKFLIVAMDYFTKWIEAKAVATITGGQELLLNLDLLEERQERAAVHEAKAKSKMMKYYNARVCGVAFKPGDFVYRNNDASHAVAGGKLRPK